MTIHSLDLKTGERTTRDWTQEELDAHAAAQPTELEIWKQEIQENDLTSRDIENIMDVLTPEQLAAIDPETKNKYDYKKSKRASKPV